MVIFIIVPALAPTIGQFILYFYSWQAIFGLLIIMGLLGILALRFKQDETLSIENRIPFSIQNLIKGIKETIKNPVSRGYTIASGLIFGAFVAYLSLAQQILQIQYRLGDKFSYYFGVLALFIGFSSYLNSKFVEKYGMRKLSNIALLSLATLSAILLLLSTLLGGTIPVYLFLVYLGISFLFIGILFGNLNTIAIEPLGHIAGIANSVISSLQTFISVGIGAIVGQIYSGTVYPLVVAFGVLSLAGFVSIKLSTKEKLFAL